MLRLFTRLIRDKDRKVDSFGSRDVLSERDLMHDPQKETLKMSSIEAPDMAAMSQDNIPMSEMDKAEVLTLIREEASHCPLCLFFQMSLHKIWPSFSVLVRQPDHHQRDWGERMEEEVWGDQSRGFWDEVLFLCSLLSELLWLWPYNIIYGHNIWNISILETFLKCRNGALFFLAGKLLQNMRKQSHKW